MHNAQRFINHVSLVLDASSSMFKHSKRLIQVADEQIRHLALRSEELNQETRVSVYTFADTVQCQIFDMDVMRLPSIKDLYTANGMTALIDATIKSQQDLETTSRLYGDHAFLSFILTDGAENQSKLTMHALERTLHSQPQGWNVAFLVPDKLGVSYLTRLGVNEGNIAIWNTASAQGIVDAGTTIKAATESFMTSRGSSSNWASRGVFSTGAEAVNEQTVKSTLTPLPDYGFKLLPVTSKCRIDDRINWEGIGYNLGKGYYELSKTETIQPQKQIIVVDKQTKKAYTGPQARDLIGLPSNTPVKVKPDWNPKYKIFVQSTSMNRNLMPSTEVLVLT